MKFLKILLLVVIILVMVGGIWIRQRFGGGMYYNDLTGNSIFPSSSLSIAAQYHEPFGNLAVSQDHRLFFTIHPESRPSTNKVMEWKDGQAVPYPSAEAQKTSFNTVLGMFIDRQNRLWTIDHGLHGFKEVQLKAFDLHTDTEVHSYTFPSKVAPIGSFFNDLQVSPDGEYVYVADVSFFGKKPGLAVYHIASGESWRVLDGHESVIPQDHIIHNHGEDMVFFGGMVALKPGIDGLVVDLDGEYLYYGAMTHDGLYRIPLEVLNNPDLSPEQSASAVERVGTKPLSDGLSIDEQDNVYITDVQHGAIHRMSPDGQLTTVIKDADRIRWADGLSFGADTSIYFTDSAIPDIMLKSKSHIKASGPYYIFRFKNDIPGRAGQ